MEKSTSPREGTTPTPLQLRLNPNFGSSSDGHTPSPRSQSLDSQTSLEDINSLDIPDITRSISPMIGYIDQEENIEPLFQTQSNLETNNAASIIQKWYKSYLRCYKSLKGMIKKEVLDGMLNLFGSSDDHKIQFINQLNQCDNGNEAIQLTNKAEIAKQVLLFLTSLPRDRILRKLPVTLHGPRAFLAGTLVMTHPKVILGDNEMSLEAKLLKNASSLLLISCRVLSKILLNYNNGSNQGQLRLFRKQLIMVRFARRYHAYSFNAFKVSDASRVVESLLSPYADLLAAWIQAKRVGNEEMSQAASMRMEQIKLSMIKLIGENATQVKLQEIEASIKQQFIDTFGEGDDVISPISPPPAPSMTPPTQDTLSPPPLPTATSGGAAEEGVSMSEIESSLVNEQIAHELILDAKYQLPELEEPKPFTTPTINSDAQPSTSLTGQVTLKEVEANIAKTMQDLFWKNLIKSLTPVKQSKREDFNVNEIVQAKYGGRNGTYYDAKILKLNDDGTYHIQYIEDNIEEYSFPYELFRTCHDTIDSRPLISLLQEVLKRLELATPNRKDLHLKYQQALDFPLLEQMLSKGALDDDHMMKLIDFFLDSLSILEAPVRAARTVQWKQDFHTYMTSTKNQSTSSSEPSPFLLVLPTLFTFLHCALNQLQRDTVNVHLTMIALKQFQNDENNIIYERNHFEDKLNKNITSLNKTHIWLESCMQSFCQSTEIFVTSTEKDGINHYLTRKNNLSLRDSAQHQIYRKAFIEYSCLDLISKAQVRLDSQEAINIIPETLILDATRLASVRDTMDRIVLVSTLIVLLRQVISSIYKKKLSQFTITSGGASGGASGGGGLSRNVMKGLTNSNANELQTQLYEMLTSPSTRLTDLQEVIIEAGHEACVNENTGTGGLSEPDETYLKGLISNAANPNNAIFTLFTKRVLKLFKIMISYDKNMSFNGQSFEQVMNDELFSSIGLQSFKEELIKEGKLLNKFIRHNINTFAPFYTTVCEDVGKALPSPPAAPIA